MRVLLGLVGALALAACSQTEPEADPPAATGAEEAVALDAELAEQEPDVGAGVETESPTQAIAAIPERFRGVWDYTEGSCAPESDLRLEVTAGDLMFYESVGEVESVEVENDNQVVVALSMTGEGETWTERTRLTLTNGGDILTPVDADGEQAGTPMPRKRCK